MKPVLPNIDPASAVTFHCVAERRFPCRYDDESTALGGNTNHRTLGKKLGRDAF